MSFPIPSFFKIRCGIIIIAFLLFFMLIGMMKQAFACPGLLPDAGYTADNHYYNTQTSASLACSSSSGASCYHNSGGGWYYYHYVSPGVQHFYAYGCTLDTSCPDSNNNGTPDACETCPKQQGYKTNLLIASYCGNTITQCDGSSHTSYEWGFGPNSCTPVQEPDCHVTADCKRDTDGDGYADDVDPDIDGDGKLNGVDDDIDGDNIPNDKDVDGDKDGDGTPNAQDACPGNPDPNCVNPCAGITDGTCKDTDGDGIKDSEDFDIDGDNIPNVEDSDIDGDGRSNAEDDDIDGDGVLNPDDEDDDSDGKLDDEDSCSSGKGSSGCDEDDDGTPDELEETATTPYVLKADPYAVNEETSSEFKEALKARFQEFLDKLKTTSLFSIPSRLNNIVPSGSGETKISVDGGQTYGQHEIDFLGWTQGLAALNALVYMACYFLAIRIIILKR